MIENYQYQTKEWVSKRKHILQRDNFTCQNCGTFNPSEGAVTIINERDNDVEIHEYDNNSCCYILSSQKVGITLNIDYGWGIWLVTPILQVHHKKYIEGKHAWEYDDSDLVTLCKDCHNVVHRKVHIPIYDSRLNMIENKIFKPEDNNTGRKHNFKPWVFVNKYSNEYKLTSVEPSIKYFVFAEDLDRIKELEESADKLYASFMERFLPDYFKDD